MLSFAESSCISLTIFFSSSVGASGTVLTGRRRTSHSLLNHFQQYSWTLHGRLTQTRFHATLTLTRILVFLRTKSVFTRNVMVLMVRACLPRISPLVVLTMAFNERAPGGARNTHLGANPRAIQGPARPHPSCVCRHIICLGPARERRRRLAFRRLRRACGNSSHRHCICCSGRYPGEQCGKGH